ncbi:MAG: hypothetical protein JF609_08135 [Verrucomicrobia bacterium]|nr:hypothetical protein [Verrucomicrobiota bacterium]
MKTKEPHGQKHRDNIDGLIDAASLVWILIDRLQVFNPGNVFLNLTSTRGDVDWSAIS